MFKRILTAMLCIVLVLGVSTMAFAKKTSEEKSALKDKISIAFSPWGSSQLRMWLTNSLGLDMKAGITVGGASDFGLSVGANIVFPMMEDETVNVYVVPGMLLGFDTTTVGGIGSSIIGFDFVVGIEAEAFIVKDLLSVAGTLGLSLGINVNSVGGASNTAFQMGLGTSPASLLFRIYI